MDCGYIQEKLSAYIDDMLTVEDRNLVESHLSSCDKCTEFLADVSSAMKQVRSLDEIEPPAWLTRDVMARIKAETTPQKSLLQKLFYPLHIKLPLEALATIAIVATSFYIFRSMPPEVKYRSVPAETEISGALSERTTMPEQDRVSKPEDTSADHKRQDAAGKDDEMRPLKKELPASAQPAEKAASAPPEDARTRKSEVRMKASEPSASRKAPAEQKKAAPAPVQEHKLYFGDSKDQMESRSNVAEEATAGKTAVQPDIILFVQDPEKAGEDIKKIVALLKGTIISSEDVANKRMLSIRIPHVKISAFNEKIKELGKTREIAIVAGEGKSTTVLILAIEKIISE